MSKDINKMTKKELFAEEERIQSELIKAESMVGQVGSAAAYLLNQYEKEINNSVADCELDEKLEKYAKEKIKRFAKQLDFIKNSAADDEVRRYKEKVERLNKLKDKVKHTLYECAICEEAVVRVIINNKTGEEVNKLVKDCGEAICPYREQFIKIADGSEIDIEKVLRKAMER